MGCGRREEAEYCNLFFLRKYYADAFGFFFYPASALKSAILIFMQLALFVSILSLNGQTVQGKVFAFLPQGDTLPHAAPNKMPAATSSARLGIEGCSIIKAR